jgi:hypothetical protein
MLVAQGIGLLPSRLRQHGCRPWKLRGWRWLRVWLQLAQPAEESTFIWCSIKVDHELVNGLLVLDINSALDECRSDDIIDVGNGRVDACDKHLPPRSGMLPFPSQALPESRNSSASWIPVEAPEGTAARCNPVSVTVSRIG